MDYAEAIVDVLLENDDLEIDVGDVVRGGMYSLKWIDHNMDKSIDLVDIGDDYKERSIPAPPTPYRPKRHRLFLRITSFIPRFAGYISFDMSPSYPPGTVTGSIRLCITNDIGWGLSFAETRVHHVEFPLKLWPVLKELCSDYLVNTARQTFMKEGTDKKTGKVLSAQGLKFKLGARFRSMFNKFQQRVAGVKNTKEFKALKLAQDEFKSTFDNMPVDWGKASEDPSAKDVPSDFERMTYDDIAFWKALGAKYPKSTGGIPDASSVPPPPTA